MYLQHCLVPTLYPIYCVCTQNHSASNRPSEQRPPVNKGHFSSFPKVVFVRRFDCTYLKQVDKKIAEISNRHNIYEVSIYNNRQIKCTLIRQLSDQGILQLQMTTQGVTRDGWVKGLIVRHAQLYRYAHCRILTHSILVTP